MFRGDDQERDVLASAQEKQSPQVCVAMMGSRMNYALPRLLYEAGMLGKFFTDTYIGNKSWLGELLETVPLKFRVGVINRLLGRKNANIPANKVVSFDLLGLRYWWWQSTATDTARLAQVYAHGAQALNQRVLRQMPKRAEVIWGFNGAALELLQYARKVGIPCILEQTIAPGPGRRSLLSEEVERWPGWQPGLVLPPVLDPILEREKEEWILADRIVAGSNFVVDGLVACGVDREKCRMVPYGVDLQRFTVAKKREKSPGDKIRILFAGEVGLRKGAPYLLEALRQIGSKGIEARFAGTVSLAPQKLQPYSAVAQFLGAVPRIQMAKLFQWADLFVLPTICEGSAVVTYEALASGLPVIATPNCGSVVRDGVDGLIVPIRDAEAIARALDHYLREPDYLAVQQQAARDERERVGLDAYRANLVSVINEL